MSISSEKFGVITTICIIVAFVTGLLVGYFALPKPDDGHNGNHGLVQGGATFRIGSCSNRIQNFSYLSSYTIKCNKDICDTTVCNFPLPSHYIAYHLNGKNITIDGRLDEKAWQEVPWSSKLVDIKGLTYPTPQFDTKFKVRWDDNRLYVGALLDATELWTTYSEDENNSIWTNNAFEVFYDADNSMQNYKQIIINVLNATCDLMLTKAYIDCPSCAGSNVVGDWSSDIEKAVYHDGEVNNPSQPGTFWSVEWSVVFSALAENTSRQNPIPSDGEVIFMQFARSQWKLNVVNGTYQKVVPEHADWWSWQPTGAVANHLPHRWGAVQFSKQLQNIEFQFPAWHVYKALFDIFEALQVFKALKGMYITDIQALDVPPYVLSGKCMDVPTIQLTERDGNPDFIVTVKSKTFAKLGHIRSDRYTWFDM